MLIDSARITVQAGRGGRGCIAFRREKYVAHGGPNGGDGGRGGDVVLQVNRNLNTLLHLHHQRFVKAASGQHGRGSNKTGASGADRVVEVPPGTVVTHHETGELLGDLVSEDASLIVARGGRGGRGNARFATSTNRVPRIAEDGTEGEEHILDLELKLIADIGLVGLPNAGKSTLLSRLSAARPKIADYPFTTLEPHLGVVESPHGDHRTLVVADIPGLIEGAHSGAGLGVQFLRHVQRCRVLVHLVDLSVLEPSIEDRIRVVRNELETFDRQLTERPYLMVGTKADAIDDREAAVFQLQAVGRRHGVDHCTISAVTGEGLREMLVGLFALAEQSEDVPEDS